MSVYIYILVMAVTTYLIRALPLVLSKKPIRSRFLRSFLYYVPVACLTAMTFPAILSAGEHVVSGGAALAVAVLLALKDRSLLEVAAASGLTVFVAELLFRL